MCEIWYGSSGRYWHNAHVRPPPPFRVSELKIPWTSIKAFFCHNSASYAMKVTFRASPAAWSCRYSNSVRSIFENGLGEMFRKVGRMWREIVWRVFVFDTVQRVRERMTEPFNNTTANNCRRWAEAQRWEIQAAKMISQCWIPNFTESTRRLRSWKLSQSEYFHFLFQYTWKDGSKPINLDELLHLKVMLDEAVSIVQQFGLDK